MRVKIGLLFALLSLPAVAADNIAYLAVQQNQAPADTFKSWNTIDDPGTTGSIVNMVDEDGNATVWDFDVDAASGEGANGVNSAGSGDAAWVDEAIISLQYHFVSTETAEWTFSDLNDAATYTFDIYCSRAGSGTRRVEVSFDSFSTTEGSINCYGNNTEILSLSGISPSTGSITMSWRAVSGDAFAYINAVRITEVDSASPVSLIIQQH